MRQLKSGKMSSVHLFGSTVRQSRIESQDSFDSGYTE